MRVLLAEDDASLGDALSKGLRRLGFTVDWVRDGAEAQQALQTEELDALVLDLGLPRRDGLSVLQTLRATGADLPVLVLTARDTVEDRIGGLDLGADDYLTKPFDLREVAARLRAIIRRREGRSNPLMEHDGLVVDPAAQSVTLNGKPVTLRANEFAVLTVLLRKSGRIVTREQLEEALYGWDEGVESNATEVYIHHLRRKLGKELIHTVRGVGYTIPKARSHDPRHGG
jgi:DNA-binding response OmpR family regulator